MKKNNEAKERLEMYRFFLKDTIRQQIDFHNTAQHQRIPAPPLQKPFSPDAACIGLPEGAAACSRLCNMTVGKAIALRESVRSYADEGFTLEELSALLWATQGVRHVLTPQCALRTVPSAGARHAFETYVVANRIGGLAAGLYRYLPFDGQLVQLSIDSQISNKAAYACLEQQFVAEAATTLFWTAIPERMEWRYDLAAHKVIAIDVGHVCQNLYLAATAMNAGVCAIAAYHQAACDQLLGVDGENEFTVYIAAVGKR